MEVVIERGVPLPGNVTLVLPEDMREELRVPLGPVMEEEEVAQHIGDGGPICTVGDMTTETLHRMGIPVHLAVVDYQTKREPSSRWRTALEGVGDRTVTVTSPAATITPSMYNTIIEAWASPDPIKVVVEGEEDMAALPAILHAPEGATVIYGIPDTGLCLVQVDGHARDVVTDVLARLESRWNGLPP
ncbi:MAG: DUF359 domain-containing protein [Thermoplasmata archaeon]|nr:MAG: DUF359 domain-containing protein [Thermoplasmata archaeon]